MIEVSLQQEEQNHPFRDYQAWYGKVGLFWSPYRLDDMTDEQKDTLRYALREFLGILEEHYHIPFTTMVTDFEICGSWAFGINTSGADMDIQLSTENYDNQRIIEHALRGDKIFLKRQVWELSHRLKLHIDIGYSEHGNKEYNICYSLRENKLYGRRPHHPTDPHFHMRYNQQTGHYEPILREAQSIFKSRFFPETLQDGDIWDEE